MLRCVVLAGYIVLFAVGTELSSTETMQPSAPAPLILRRDPCSGSKRKVYCPSPPSILPPSRHIHVIPGTKTPHRTFLLSSSIERWRSRLLPWPHPAPRQGNPSLRINPSVDPPVGTQRRMRVPCATADRCPERVSAWPLHIPPSSLRFTAAAPRGLHEFDSRECGEENVIVTN